MSKLDQDVVYKEKGVTFTDNPLDTVSKIEILVKALGTMVLKPQFTQPALVGEQKIQLQPVQEGILVGENRTIAENKLVELIKQL